MGEEMPRAVSPKKCREQMVEVPLVMQDLREPVVQVLLVALGRRMSVVVGCEPSYRGM